MLLFCRMLSEFLGVDLLSRLEYKNSRNSSLSYFTFLTPGSEEAVNQVAEESKKSTTSEQTDDTMKEVEAIFQLLDVKVFVCILISLCVNQIPLA